MTVTLAVDLWLRDGKLEIPWIRDAYSGRPYPALAGARVIPAGTEVDIVVSAKPSLNSPLTDDI